ncbi:MAG: RHS repeat-associated core domain-containing protein, partial [Holophagales bacterium]|nr:RHS repeat-associated core domain-containing protein [Holophagales bacterium]
RANLPDYMVKGGVTYALIPDHLGSPRLVVDIATGAVAQRLHYDEFGRITLDTNPGFQPFGFVGGLYDPQTGLVRFGARDYDPEVGRWTAPDPAGFAGGDPSLYAYASNNPVSFLDMTGYSIGSAVRGFGKGLAAGIVVGVVAGAAVAAAPAAAPLFVVAGVLTLATAYFEGQALYYDPAVSEDAMHEYIGEVAGAVVGCGLGYKGFNSAQRGMGGLNPFRGKTPAQIERMLLDRGFIRKGPDPVSGKGTYVNPRTGRSIHIDANHPPPKPPHVSIQRPRNSRALPPREYPLD